MRSFECCLKPQQGECAAIATVLPSARYTVISGEVHDSDNSPIPDLLVLLLSYEKEELLSHTITDSLGHFWFGPLGCDTLYRVRIQQAPAQVRIVEVKP